MQRADSIEEYIESHGKWSAALTKLRKLMLSTELEECVKWGVPCYTLGGKNVLGMAAFKEHLALWFHQGVFLKDPLKVLINAQEGTTKALRQWRFTSERAIRPKDIKPYLLEAIANQKQGKQIKPERDKALVIPGELRGALAKDAKAKLAFFKLTPGQQREYADHIASAKREPTKLSRIEKALPLIRSGVGLNDKYRNC